MNNNNSSRTLLIGNGINRIYEGQVTKSKAENSLVTVVAQKSKSWDDLLSTISIKYGVGGKTNKTIPSPIFFDSIINRKAGDKSHNDKIKQLKENIARVISNSSLQPNKYHKDIMGLTTYSDILTTNYDYCLEKSIIPDFSNQRSSLSQNKDEYVNSLKRCYLINDKKVWHIHGELYNSRKQTLGHYPEESILIGFEQYCVYLENIIKNIKEKRNIPAHSIKKDWTYKTLAQRIEDTNYNLADSPFWIDRFFVSDLDIIGFGFDYSETHLWWLLSYRARLVNEGKVKNNIRYFFPDMSDSTNSLNKEAGIRFMLNSLGVECVPVKCKDYEEFYGNFINGNY